MKSVGIVRKVDELGRIVLPVELRRKFGVEIHDSLEIYTDDTGIIRRAYSAATRRTCSSSAVKTSARTARKQSSAM